MDGSELSLKQTPSLNSWCWRKKEVGGLWSHSREYRFSAKFIGFARLVWAWENFGEFLVT